VFARTAVGALLLLPLALRSGELGALRRHWRPLVAFAALEIIIPWGLLSQAERKLPSSLAGLLIAAVPLIGAVITWLTRGDDRFDVRRIGGLLLGLVGVAALVGLNVSFRDLGAVAEVGLVAIGYATGPIIVSRRLTSLPSMAVVAASLVLTAVAYAPLALPHLPARLPSVQVLLAVANAYCARGRRRLQWSSGDERAVLAELVREREVFADDGIPLVLGQTGPRLLVVVDQEHVLHGCLLRDRVRHYDERATQ